MAKKTYTRTIRAGNISGRIRGIPWPPPWPEDGTAGPSCPICDKVTEWSTFTYVCHPCQLSYEDAKEFNDIADLALDTMTEWLRSTAIAFAQALVFQEEGLRYLDTAEHVEVIDRLTDHLRGCGMQWCEEEVMRQLPPEGNA